jgi:hypothetical protein
MGELIVTLLDFRESGRIAQDVTLEALLVNNE